MVTHTLERPATRKPKRPRANSGAVDHDQFQQLVVGEMGALYRTALHLSRNPDDASDLMQESCLRAFNAEDRFQLGDRGVRPWLLKILYNVFCTRFARKRLEPVLMDSLEHSPARGGDDAAERCWDLATLDWEQVDDRLKKAVQFLPEHYRDVLLLWAVEGLRYRDIAEMLGVPLGTVMSRLHRARAILSEQLGDLAAEHGMALDGSASLT